MSQRPSIFNSDFATVLDYYTDPLIAGATNVLAAAAILLIGLWLSGFAAKSVRRYAEKHPNIDNTLAAFFSSVVRYAILAFVVLAVLRRFGVETTSIVAVLGAASLAVGLALQGTLSNVAAGVMLMLFRPYRLGDKVEIAGKQGAVRDVGLFTTELATDDNLKVVLPNGLCWGQAITNFSANDRRRADVEIVLANTANLETATQLIVDAASADARIKKLPAPKVEIVRFTDKTIVVVAQAWSTAAEHADVQPALARRIVQALDAAGVPRGAP